MIRRAAHAPELGLDSLTDTMTNMMGLILLMVIVSAIVSGGTRLVLLGQLADPAGKQPVYLVCKDGRVLFVHRGNAWKRDLSGVCADLRSHLGRKPTTGEALIESNTRGLCRDSDLRPTFVRERAREAGRDVYVIGIRFHPRQRGALSRGQRVPTAAAARVLATLDPGTHYVDAFVYQSGVDALKWLQAYAKDRGLSLGWRPMLRHQNPGLSDYGVPGTVGAEQ